MFLVSFAKIVFSHNKYATPEPPFLSTNFLFSLVKDVAAPQLPLSPPEARARSTSVLHSLHG